MVRDNADMEASTKSSLVRCLIELVANSLTEHAKAIAVRIHAEKHNVHVIDNSVGMPKDMLQRITEENNRVLTSISYLSDSFSIASRYQHSMETFMKVFKAGSASNVMQIEQRPSCGTTVSVYSFHKTPQEWDMFTICFLVGAIAVTKSDVSFSIRDETRSKVVLRIAKPHSPIEVLKTLFGKDLSLNHVWSIQCNSEYDKNYHGYIGISDQNAIQWIFLNFRLICCPFILKLIKIAFKEKLNLSFDREYNVEGIYDENIFILFFLTFPENKFTFITENGERHVIFYDMQEVLSSIKNCVFKCLSEDVAFRATPHLRKTQLLKQIYLNSEGSVFIGSHISDHRKNIVSLVRENKIVRIKKRKITSTIVTNYSIEQCNKVNNIEAVSCHIRKENSTINSIQCRINNASTKLHTEVNLYKDTSSKIYNDVDERQTIFTNIPTFALTNDSTESNKTNNYHNDNDNDLANIISPLSEWSDWTYTNTKEHRSVRDMCDLSKNDTHAQQTFKCAKQFDFLPRKLCGLLQYRHVKLTNVKCFNSIDDTLLFAENWEHQHSLGTVHSCNLKQKLCEFRVSRAALKCIKTINQVNNEFIVASMTYNNMKVLLMIDQHAVHERIRYENLLLRYKMQNEDELLSVNLRDPLAVEFPKHICNLLLNNKTLLKKYGISLGSSKENTLLIRTIPQCLITSNDHTVSEKVLPKIYSLLLDILKNRNTTHHANTLPLTIHNAIASEACHGAIKFGDKLTAEQCTYLMQLLGNTKFPNRCAHGRPTIIPVMELSELEKRNVRIPGKKLNFASLKGHHRDT